MGGVFTANTTILFKRKSALIVSLLLKGLVVFIELGHITKLAAGAALESNWLPGSLFDFCHKAGSIHNSSGNF